MDLAELAGWVASAAVMVAAIMTASNLGARVTGWGFLVFTLGSLAWIANAALQGQTSLLVTNAFLTLVNLFGVWRWLGREARYRDAGAVAERRSRRAASPDLIALSRLPGMPLLDERGVRLGHVVDAMARRDTGEPAYVVAAFGGIGGLGEQLYGVPGEHLRFNAEMNAVLIGVAEPEKQLPRLGDTWPARLPAV